jgi:hypothetical protein
MRQRESHPQFVVKIEAGYEIEETQIVSLSALLYFPIGSTENRSLRHGRFSGLILPAGLKQLI